MGQSQDDSIVGTKQCRHSVAIMPIPGNLSSSSPDLLQPATSVLDFSNPAGKKTCCLNEIKVLTIEHPSPAVFCLHSDVSNFIDQSYVP